MRSKYSQSMERFRAGSYSLQDMVDSNKTTPKSDPLISSLSQPTHVMPSSSGDKHWIIDDDTASDDDNNKNNEDAFTFCYWGKIFWSMH